MHACFRSLAIAALILAPACFSAATLQAREPAWTSAAVGADIPAVSIEADTIQLPPGQRFPSLLVYMKNLACERVGQEPDEVLLKDFAGEGYRIVTLDYGKNPKAKSPELNADVNKIREDLKGGFFPTTGPVDTAHVYILPEGYRLDRDVPFYVDGPTSITMRMDIAYPCKPSRAVPVVMEFSCDNLRRMGNSSMAGITDSILEGAPAAGLAWAMCDHPVAKSYHGMDPMPDSLYKAKAAVRTLRAEGKKLGLAGGIGVYGFSRGAGVAAMLADARAGLDDKTGLDFSQNIDAPMRRMMKSALQTAKETYEVGGLNPDESSAVQAVMVGSGRFDYTNMADSPDLDRYAKAWGGPLETNRAAWEMQGALHYIGHRSAPFFIMQYTSDGPPYVTQAALLDKRLTSLGVPHSYKPDPAPRGHHITNDPNTLAEIYDFFRRNLNAYEAPGAKRPRLSKPAP